MSSGLRAFDKVGRLGGEEFAAFFPETDAGGASLVCERLRSELRQVRVNAGNQRIGATVSIGLTQLTADTDDADGLLQQADDLLYRAKASGRDRIAVDSKVLKQLVS